MPVKGVVLISWSTMTTEREREGVSLELTLSCFRWWILLTETAKSHILYSSSVVFGRHLVHRHWVSYSSENPLCFADILHWNIFDNLQCCRLMSQHSSIVSDVGSSHLIMILLKEVEFLLQAVQVSTQSGDDLVMVRLCPPQSLTVPLYWLAQHSLRLPSAE